MNSFAELLVTYGLEKVTWFSALVICAFFFLSGVAYIISQKGRRDIHFAKAAFLEFIACWVIYIPEDIFSKELSSHTGLKIAEGLLIALRKSINLYSGSVFEGIDFDSYEIFGIIYNIVGTLANIALFLFLGGFIVKLFARPLQQIRLSIYKRRVLYIFSECNEKTLAIANSIPEREDKKKTLIIFTDVYSDDNWKYRSEVANLKGIYVDDSIESIVKKCESTAKEMEIFLFGMSEDNNIAHLYNICSVLQNPKKRKILIRVELERTPWDLYDNYVECHNLDGKNVIVNFVRAEETFVYSTLLQKSVFKNAIQDDDYKRIRALIVGGYSYRNVEFIKALLHLGQMPGYLMEITVIDDSEGRDKLKRLMPEVYDEAFGEGDALYKLNYIENIDYNAASFERILREEIGDYTFVFVNAGDDLLNVELALLIKEYAYRNNRSFNDFTLLVNIYNKGIWNKWNIDLCKEITPIGCIDDIYNYRFITFSDIERAAHKIHMARHASEKQWIDYLNNEYNRHQVFARALSYVYKIKVLHDDFNAKTNDDYRVAGKAEGINWNTREELEKIWDSFSEEEKRWKKYEHMRWNMYTRTLGYRKDANGQLKKLVETQENNVYDIKSCNQDDLSQLESLKENNKNILKEIKEKRRNGMIHNDLVMFDDLALSEKIKDNLELTDDVIEVLKELAGI